MFFITKESEIIFDKLQGLYFYASWMPFHKKMLIMIKKIEEKYKNVTFLAIDVDYFPTLCKRFSVESIPAVIVLKEGQEIKRINGLVMTSAFKSNFADICIS